MPRTASTNCSWATRAIWPIRRSSSTPLPRYDHPGTEPHPIISPRIPPLPFLLGAAPRRPRQRLSRDTKKRTQPLTRDETGIRRQPRHPLPRDLGEERQQRRAGLPHHGPPDQGAHGHRDGEQHETQRPGRARPGRRLVLQRALLLSGRCPPFSISCLPPWAENG